MPLRHSLVLLKDHLQSVSHYLFSAAEALCECSAKLTLLIIAKIKKFSFLLILILAEMSILCQLLFTLCLKVVQMPLDLRLSFLRSNCSFFQVCSIFQDDLPTLDCNELQYLLEEILVL